MSYAPFILINHTGSGSSLVLFDPQMAAKTHVFKALERERWCGNGHDWSSIAQRVIKEFLPGLEGTLSFAPENRMFVVHGPRPALERLGEAMSKIFHDDEKLKDVLSRADSLIFRLITQLCFWCATVRTSIAGFLK